MRCRRRCGLGRRGRRARAAGRQRLPAAARRCRAGHRSRDPARQCCGRPPGSPTPSRRAGSSPGPAPRTGNRRSAAPARPALAMTRQEPGEHRPQPGSPSRPGWSGSPRPAAGCSTPAPGHGRRPARGPALAMRAAARGGRRPRRGFGPRLISGRLVLLLMSSFGALTSFYLLLSVTPMYAVSAGAGSAEAGVVTGSLMLATVLAELASPRLMRRYGYRALFAVGALLLGGPTLALLAPRSVDMIVAVSLARGLGFGLNTVVTGALLAAALPPERRGEGIGLAGVVACVPAIVALPSGIWLAEKAGYGVVIAITAATALAPLGAVRWLARPGDRRAQAAPAPLHPPPLPPTPPPAPH